ncbi:MAG: FkbM family methyltransferase [Pseudomonadota bacterium]
MKPKRALRRFWMRAGIRLPEWLLDNELRAMRRMAEECAPDQVVIDLGAHVGKSAIEFAHVVREVHAFEPNPVNFAELQKQTGKYPNISIYPKAVAAQNGTTKLFFENAKPGRFYEGSTIVEGKSNVSYGKHFDVETMAIEDILQTIQSDNILIKMDIEGAEYIVLDALLASKHLDRIGKVYVECHVDRIPELKGPKEKVLAKAREIGFFDKIDFDWP